MCSNESGAVENETDALENETKTIDNESRTLENESDAVEQLNNNNKGLCFLDIIRADIKFATMKEKEKKELKARRLAMRTNGEHEQEVSGSQLPVKLNTAYTVTQDSQKRKSEEHRLCESEGHRDHKLLRTTEGEIQSPCTHPAATPQNTVPLPVLYFRDDLDLDNLLH